MKTVLVVGLCVGIGTGLQAQDSVKACPKYQHDESLHWMENCQPVPGSDLIVQCDPTPPVCVDDMHAITEKGWQAIQARLGALEAQIAMDHSVHANHVAKPEKKPEIPGPSGELMAWEPADTGIQY